METLNKQQMIDKLNELKTIFFDEESRLLGMIGNQQIDLYGIVSRDLAKNREIQETLRKTIKFVESISEHCHNNGCHLNQD